MTDIQQFDVTAHEHALAVYANARAIMEAGNFEQAISLFTQSASFMPHYKTLELLGDCYLRLRRYKEAIIPLAAATGLNKQARPPMLLAEAFFRLGELSDAEQAARCAVERLPHHKRAVLLLEQIIAARESAIAALPVVLASDDERKEARNQAGDIDPSEPRPRIDMS